MKKDKRKRQPKKNKKIFMVFLPLLILFFLCSILKLSDKSAGYETSYEVSDNFLNEIPEFSGEPYIILNENDPDFTSEEKENREAFEYYSELDRLGRCGAAYANICKELMPTEERQAIGHIKPSGWQIVKYDGIDGNYLYNRCHLIGFQLAGENANEKNLITGTRYMNVSGMLPFENLVADYVRRTDHHVLYRVTPHYRGNDLVAAGVQMEAYSIEDEGDGVCFHVFVYNSQPEIGIDYATGESWILKEDVPLKEEEAESGLENADMQTYVLNNNTKKFHLLSCDSANDMKGKNRKEVVCSRAELIENGYEPCQRCNP